MSFAPRPINTPNPQHRRFELNLPISGRSRGQTHSKPSNNNLNHNLHNGNYNHNAGNNYLSDNNIADFTARRQQQVSPARTPIYSSHSRQSLGFSANPKTSPTPNFVPPTPWWLRSLFFLKYGSGLVMGGLILATLTVYGSNVSTQRQWSENYRELESLRRTERQLVVANEVIKNKAAQESSTTKELIKADPARRIYLPTPNPMPEPSPKVMVMGAGGSTSIPKPETPSKNYPNLPLGY